MESLSSPPGRFIDPNAIIAQICVLHGSVVADFGCGPGYFSLPFAKAVGDEGKVYSLDVLPQALESVVNTARAEGISNITAQRVNLENEHGSRLRQDSFDWVIMKDVLFQNAKKEHVIKEAYRILKKGGRVILVEWGQGDLSVGPEKNLRILPDDLRAMFIAQGFSIEKDVKAGNFHYSFVAVK